MKTIVFIIFFMSIYGCGSGGGGVSFSIVNNNSTDRAFISADTDYDYIPDDIEILLGMDINNSDEDNNGVIDGLQSSGVHGDKFFDKEWHIISLGNVVNDSGVTTIVGNDLDIKDVYHRYMGYNHGNNIIVQVVDSGVDSDHEDLVHNMDMTRSLDGVDIGNPSSISNNSHGTMVAGIIAARAFNEKGVRGVAPFVKIAGSNFIDKQSISALEKAWCSATGANDIAVSNNSWGSENGMDTSADSSYEDMMSFGTTNLRNQKGRIYVFAAGNERVDENGDRQSDANINYYLNSRYPVVVAAIGHDNRYSPYSNPGANLLVSAYSGNTYQLTPTIATTVIMGTSNSIGDINTKTTWSEDVNHNYTFAMNGTSAAAPIVSASLALLLEACPDLGWRDVKYLIAKHARHIDVQNSSWFQNGAGLWYSRDYGYGLINPKGMIDECVDGYTNFGAEIVQTLNKNFNVLIPDDRSKKSFILTITEPSIVVEWVEVTIDNDSNYASDYIIELISPMGTKVTLVDINQASRLNKPNWLDGGFRLSSASMMGENSRGEWKIEIKDMQYGDVGTLKSINLKIYGHER